MFYKQITSTSSELVYILRIHTGYIECIITNCLHVNSLMFCYSVYNPAIDMYTNKARARFRFL